MGVPDAGNRDVLFVLHGSNHRVHRVHRETDFGLPATPQDEEPGIDEAEHAETAYDFASVGPGSAPSMAGAGKEA
jgi:hypothetical protein